jgi:membrane protein YdbS with pleckstrin-like domain
VSSADEHTAAIFEPLRPASRGRLVLGLILGPILWLAALVVVAWTLHFTWAIEAGLIVTLGTFVLSLVALSLLRWRRQRERQHAARR